MNLLSETPEELNISKLNIQPESSRNGLNSNGQLQPEQQEPTEQ